MFLPEHREQLLERRREQKKQARPELDEDQLVEIDRVIAESLHSKTEITLTTYDPFESRRLTGYVVRVNQNAAQVLIQCSDGDEWIDKKNILRVDV